MATKKNYLYFVVPQSPRTEFKLTNQNISLLFSSFLAVLSLRNIHLSMEVVGKGCRCSLPEMVKNRVFGYLLDVASLDLANFAYVTRK